MSWPIVSQHPNVAPFAQREYADTHYLPKLVKLWKLIETVTGYRWRSTSYWRRSPSHSSGCAFDIAPDIAQSAAHFYAVTNMSDPVLYKRQQLIRDLQRVCLLAPDFTNVTMGIFIEPDHLHLQILSRTVATQKCRVIKWKVIKPVFPDSESRMALPMFKQSSKNKLQRGHK